MSDIADGFDPYEWRISMVYLEACVAHHNALTGGDQNTQARFLAAANAIQDAWPDIIERYAVFARGAAPPPSPMTGVEP